MSFHALGVSHEIGQVIYARNISSVSKELFWLGAIGFVFRRFMHQRLFKDGMYANVCSSGLARLKEFLFALPW